MFETVAHFCDGTSIMVRCGDNSKEIPVVEEPIGPREYHRPVASH